MDVSDILYFLSARGGGRWSSRCREGGVGFFFFFFEKFEDGGVSKKGRGRGAGRMSAANWGLGGWA